LLWGIISIVGLILGVLYFSIVCQASLYNKVRWQQILSNWFWQSGEVFLLTLVWLGILLGVSVPAFCILSVAAMGNIALGQCVTFLYGSFLIFVIFQLLFSPHGIFAKQSKVFLSIRQGMRIIKLTFPSASLFFMSILLLVQGFDLLWRIPPENSWLTLIGLAGHGFVTTGLLASSFLYFRDADHWIMSLQDQVLSQETQQSIN